jgi:phosphatidate cytidylyltransferase
MISSKEFIKKRDFSLIKETMNLPNYLTRLISGGLMILFFIFLILSGPIPLVILVFSIQILVFKEVISVGHRKFIERKIPWFRTNTWLFLIGTLIFLYGENLLNFLSFNSPDLTKSSIISVSFLFYISGLVVFVINLKEGHYRFQFSQLSITILSLLFIVVQSHFVIKNLEEGLIWFVLPSSYVIVNDISAYLVGKNFGRTKLLKLSPKKTLEGYLGGIFLTLLFSYCVRNYFFL